MSDTLHTAQNRLSAFYEADVFPSDENVAREKQNRTKLEGWFDELTSELRKGNVVSSERSPSRFLGILERTRERLLQMAQEAGTRLPDGFAFGFERYTGTGMLPSPDDVPRLTEQLVLITRLSRILFQNGVRELRVLERTVFEDAPATQPTVDTPPSAVPGRRAARTPEPAARPRGVATAGQPGVIPDGALFGKYRFAIEFDAREENLLKVLNALASSQAFTVVNVIRLSKNVPVFMPDERRSSTASPAETRRAADHATGDAQESPVTRRVGPEFPISGLDKELPLRVRVEMDVYKFKGDNHESGR